MHILDEELYQAGTALAACPTAPGYEQFTRASVEKKLADLPGITTRRDEFGNLLARYCGPRSNRTPLRLVAHLDHPGFVVERNPEGAPALYFAGGVEERYFLGKMVTFYGTEHPESLGQAMITATDFSGERKRVVIKGTIPNGASFGTWTLPSAHCTKGPNALFVSPACDDLVQVATMVALLRRLSAHKAPGDVEALFTRSEETGFFGALAAFSAREKLELRPTISLETSSAHGFAGVGLGPILRVGDRTSVFNSQVTSWLEHAFQLLEKQNPQAKWQRLLMAGGTCEATVFHRAGYPTGALCVGLNQYHNMSESNKIASESISLRDWQGLYDYLYFLVTEALSLTEVEDKMAERFDQLRDAALKKLTQLPLTDPA